jgi:beta-xylosidase
MIFYLKRKMPKVFCLQILLSIVAISYAQNPIITGIYTADPSAHVWGDGKVWLYPSHDQDDATNYKSMDGHHVFSSSDLVNWTDHGVIMHTDSISWAREGWLWAPDAAYKNGTYYYYYPARIETNKTWRIGVATSTSPAGPFKDQGYIEGTHQIDPAVFVDDDGQAYLFWGGYKLKYALLNDDMISIKGKVMNLKVPNYYEGPWMHKKDDTYYLSYATGKYSSIDYCTSDSPTGPWTYQGVLMTPEVTGGITNHHSIVEFKDQWYIFYHSIGLSRNDYRRSVCMDKLYYNKDGTMQKVIQTDGLGNALERHSIAEYGTATQSSTLDSAYASLAIDGDTTSSFNESSISQTETEDSPWWQVELDKEYKIGDINILGTKGENGTDMVSEYTVSVINAKGKTTYSKSFNAYSELSTNAGGIKGQMIKIQLNAPSCKLTLAEVQVYRIDDPKPIKK